MHILHFFRHLIRARRLMRYEECADMLQVSIVVSLLEKPHNYKLKPFKIEMSSFIRY